MSLPRTLATLLLAILLVPAASRAKDSPPERKVVSVGLFKNGICIVTEELVVPGDGVYQMKNVPSPVHGTFWIRSDALVETRVTNVEVEEPLSPERMLDFQRSLAGRNVNIHLRHQDKIISGIVEQIPTPAGPQNWDRRYRQPQYGYFRSSFGASRAATNVPVAPGGDFLILRDPSRSDLDCLYVNLSDVVAIERVARPNAVAPTMRVKKPMLEFSVTKTGGANKRIQVSYLTKGMAWTPSYHLDLSDTKRVQLIQKAIIRNEFAAVKDTELFLISGYPNIPFSHVLSPMAAQQTMAKFFQQLQQRPSSRHDQLTNVTTQQVGVFNADLGAGAATNPNPTGEGADIYYHSVGRRSLNEGDSLVLQTAEGAAEYERVVLWELTDARDAYGRIRTNNHQERTQDQVWDVIRFDNPLVFPMTTGAAMFVEQGQFRGQTTSVYTNPKAQVTLKVNKALSIHATSLEFTEVPDSKRVYINGHQFNRAQAKGKLKIANDRRASVRLVVRCPYSGELVRADGDPKNILLQESRFSYNPRNQLTWEITLEAGQTKELDYEYSVWVRY